MRFPVSTLREKVTLQRAAASAVLAFFTTFAFVANIAEDAYAQLPFYKELLCGVTIWRGYPKDTDLGIAHFVLLALPALFLLFLILSVLWDRYAPCAKKSGLCFAAGYLACLFFLFTGKTGWEVYLTVVVYAAFAYCLLGGGVKDGRLSEKEAVRRFCTASYGAFLFTAAGFALLTAAVAVRPAFARLWDGYSAAAPHLFGLLLLELAVSFRINPPALLFSRFTAVLSLIVAAAPAVFSRWLYSFTQDGAPSLIRLFYSAKMKLFCLLLAVLFLGFLGKEILPLFITKQKEKQTDGAQTERFVPTGLAFVLPLALLRVYRVPEGIMSIDYFHNGEILLPMQQLLSFHKLPYRDLIPIHGFCDYYYGFLNVLFFDGSYLSLNAAKVAGDLLMALFYAALLYVLIGKVLARCKAADAALFGMLRAVLIWLVIPFFVGTGMRYCMLFAMFSILFFDDGKDPYRSIYLWVLFSIVSIAWNPAIGGAGALAFLPVMLLRFRDGGLSMLKKLLSVSGVLLFALGIAFIPLFLHIVSYLRDNTATTVFANGMEMLKDKANAAESFVPGLWGSDGTFFMEAFGLCIPLLVFLLLFFLGKRQMGGRFIALLLLLYVMAGYAYVRYDDGLRTGVLGCFTLLLTALSLWELPADKQNDALQDTTAAEEHAMQEGAIRSRNSGFVAAGCLAFGVFLWLFGGSPLLSKQENAPMRVIPASEKLTIMGKETEEPIVYLTGESAGLPHLGNGFISANALLNLQNIQTVLQNQGGSVLELTNAPAYEVIFEQALFWPYTSVYNVSNRRMQEAAADLLRENPPEVLLLAPGIVFDEAPLSFRSFALYKTIEELGYVPYTYQNVLYLLRADVQNKVPDAAPDPLGFAQAMHKTSLGYLPAIWGRSLENGIGEQLSEVTVSYRVEEREDGCAVLFDAPVSGKDFDLILFTDPEASEAQRQSAADGQAAADPAAAGEGVQEAEEGRYRLSLIKGGNADPDESRSMQWTSGEKMLLPIGTSPYFTQSTGVEGFYLTGEKAKTLKLRFFRLQ